MPSRPLLEVLRLSTTYLTEKGSASARLDAEVLVGHALGISRMDIYCQFERPLSDGELTTIRELIRRRGQSEPVAYLTGQREFYGRSFEITPGVLVPRPDTEALITSVVEWVRQGDHTSVRIADIGTGSGCIACTLAAELPEAHVVAVDISDVALQSARRNAERLEVADRVTVKESMWAEQLRSEEPFDVIVSNPPYISSGEIDDLSADVRSFEPLRALDGGVDGLDAYRQLFASIHLLPGAPQLIVVEIDPRREQGVKEVMERVWPGSTLRTVNDLAGRARVVVGENVG